MPLGGCVEQGRAGVTWDAHRGAAAAAQLTDYLDADLHDATAARPVGLAATRAANTLL